MNRLEFFLAAMKAELFRKKNWVISAFAVVQEGPDDYKKDPYPYRLVQLPTGTHYVNPDNINELVLLEGTQPGQPPFLKQDKITLKAGDVINLTEDVTTSYGNLLANYILLVWPFKAKLPFALGKITPGRLEGMILPLLEDDPKSQDEYEARIKKNPNIIFVNQYLKFTNAMTYISGFANLWVGAGTEKALLPPPGVKELRDKLIEQYKDRLDDPATIALIAKELVALDAKWLEGDDTLNFLISKKNFEVVRAKKFLMIGAEAGLGDGQQVQLIENSLHEGWEVDSIPAMVDNLRAGSFNRGAETMKGGESVKWLLRASGNINIKPGDCGTDMGVDIVLDPAKMKKYLNFTAITDKGLVKLEDGVIGQYLGKALKIRSPMYCKLGMTDYCATCVGPRLAENPTGASSAISNFGSTMMLMFMKAVHGKALILHKYDYKARIA